MTVIEHRPVIISVEIVADDDHWVCCSLPDDFVGITTTFCGLTSLEHCPPTVDSVKCEECMRMETSNFCPLGHDCGPVDE